MAHFDVPEIVESLRQVRQQWRDAQGRSSDWGGREFPSREALGQVIERIQGALFPMRLGPLDLNQQGEDFYIGHTLGVALQQLLAQVRLELRYAARLQDAQPATLEARAVELTRTFGKALPGIRQQLDLDVLAAFQGDPAARSVDEVLLCYPGVLALVYHRLAHALYRLDLPLLARMIAEISHAQTGIDIHPGASIGSGFFIDHGTGVVIGETAVIGQRVRLYQAVTLGAKRFPVDAQGVLQKGLPRHPIVEDDVVIYAGATVLGRVRIGRGAVLGGNVWVTHDVPAGAHVSQAVARSESYAGVEEVNV